MLGIDEAGRGAVIGPLVIAGVMFEKKNLEKLEELNVKDSKLLSPEERENLYREIIKIAKDWAVIKIPASEIDALRKRISLNLIELKKMAELINAFKPRTVYLDCPQVSTEKFTAALKAHLKCSPHIVAENFADRKYAIVSAASIVAKVERDREIEKIKREVGVDFGVGYPHDERTVKFLESLAPDYPDFVRKSWITSAEIKSRKSQTTLENF